MLFIKKMNIIIKYGLYLLVFLLPIQTRWIIRTGELGEYGTVSLYGTDLVLIILIVLFIIYKFQTNSKSKILNFKQIPKIWWSIAGLDLMIFVSIFFAQDKLVAIYGYARFLLGVGLFWLIVSASYNKVKLVYSLLAGMFLQSCLGIWQFLTQSDFACKWLGMAVHSAGDLGVSVIETLSGERWLRAYGGLGHPNVLGGLLVVGLLLLLWLFIINPKFQILNNKRIQNSKFQITNLILFFIFCFLLSALFFTFSRGAWAGLIAGLLVILVMAVVRKNLLQQKKLLQIIFVSAVLIFILFNQFSDLALTRLSKDTRLEIKSNVERVESYRDSWELIKDNWLFGAGIGNYTLEIKNQKSKIKSHMPSWHYQPAHNVFLLVWAEIGIIGLLFFILIPLLIIHNLLFKNNLRGNDLNIKFSLLAAILPMLLVDHWWWSLHFGVLFFWLVMGLIIKKLEFTD